MSNCAVASEILPDTLQECRTIRGGDVAGYTSQLREVSEIDAGLHRQMFELYAANYDCTDETTFLDDLLQKDEAVLVYYDHQLIGFSTLLFYEQSWNGNPIRIVYSGDTIVKREHWGQQALAFSLIQRMGEFKCEKPQVPLYWFLLVKGHRTFKYLSVYGNSFYPHWRNEREELKPLADMLATEKFAGQYNRETGVVEFEASQGHLKRELAEPSDSEMKRDAVRFFLDRNPGYRQGHELVCLLELEPDNLKPFTRRLFSRGSA